MSTYKNMRLSFRRNRETRQCHYYVEREHGSSGYCASEE
jgi:hypothetical protein